MRGAGARGGPPGVWRASRNEGRNAHQTRTSPNAADAIWDQVPTVTIGLRHPCHKPLSYLPIEARMRDLPSVLIAKFVSLCGGLGTNFAI